MKVIRHSKRSRDPLLHIETDLGIVNIRVGLHESTGKPVTSIEIIPDQGVTLDGYRNSRLIQEGPDEAT